MASDPFDATFLRRPRAAAAFKSLCRDDIVRGSVRELGNVFDNVLTNDQNVMLSVAAGARLTFGDPEHWFHRDNHARFQNRVDIFA